MNDKERIEFLEKYVGVLEKEKAAALDALDLASELGNFSVHSQADEMRRELLWEICSHAHRMTSFQAVAIYLVDEDTQDFLQAFVAPEDASWLDAEVQDLIADQSFAYALQTDGPTFFLSKTKKHHLILHPLSTRSRVRGMFVGQLQESKDSILDTTLKLFSVVMLSAAHALENLETHEFMRNLNRKLDRKVKERTRELKEAHERLSKTINAMQAGVVLIEAATKKIVEANPVALEMIGGTLEEVVGHRCHQFICPAEEGKCPIMDLGQQVDSSERILRSMDGHEIPILKTISQITIHNKLHLVESFIDISEQKKLASLKEDVDRIMRHDLKGPLNGIVGIPDVLLMERNKLTEEQQEYIEYIKTSGYKLLHMINSSLDLFKMETGTYKYNPSGHDLMAVVRNVHRDQAHEMKVKRIHLKTLLDGQEPEDNTKAIILCEEFLLYSLLSNLIKNAIEASPDGENVTLDIRRSAEETTISLHNIGAVPAEIRDNLFDKYVTQGKVGGTGLGTYSAKLITETMGGTIACESNEDAGTTIVLRFPV